MEIIINGIEESHEGPLTVADYLKLRDIASANIVVEWNGRILKSEDYVETSLNKGDQLEILKILGGG